MAAVNAWQQGCHLCLQTVQSELREDCLFFAAQQVLDLITLAI